MRHSHRNEVNVSQNQPEQGNGASHSAAGHRTRLRRRLLDGGAEALADYEVLEYLLYAAIPRGDTKPAAKALLARFGSLATVLDADHRALAEVEGVGEASAAALKAVALAARRMARSKVREKTVLGSWQALLDYLTIDMAHLTVERVRILYLDARNRLILDHMAQEGTIDEAAIHPREVVKKGARSRRQRTDTGAQPPERQSRAEPGRHPDHPAHRRSRAPARHHRPRPRDRRQRRAREPEGQGADLKQVAGPAFRWPARSRGAHSMRRAGD